MYKSGSVLQISGWKQHSGGFG